MEKVLGGMYEGKEYQFALQEAREEFLAWERNKKRNRVNTKAKFKAQRLAKLHMMSELLAEKF